MSETRTKRLTGRAFIFFPGVIPLICATQRRAFVTCHPEGGVFLSLLHQDKPVWRNGRRGGLKIRCPLKACRFESYRR